VDFIRLVVDQDVRPRRPHDDQPFMISDDFWSLMEACWAKISQERPKAIKICDNIADVLSRKVPLQLDPSLPRYSSSNFHDRHATGGNKHYSFQCHIHHAITAIQFYIHSVIR
jgi:hypothetical protein